MSGAGTARDNYDTADVTGDEVPDEVADEEDLEEDAVKVARRAVRRFPEETEGMVAEHEPLPLTRLSCDCPEVLTKGTLVSVVVALAFLGLFSTSVLLLVFIWILHLLGKQKKAETGDPSLRPLPPIPCPRPGHMLGHRRRSAHPYEILRPARLVPQEGVYLSANEINPGPRVPRDLIYGSPGQMSPGAKFTPENEYVGPEPMPPLTPPEAIYARLQRSSGTKLSSPSGTPGFHGGSPGYPSGSPGFHGGSPTLPSGSPGGSPASPVGRTGGADDHIYEDVN